MHTWLILFTDGTSRRVQADYMTRDGDRLFGPPGDYIFCIGGSCIYSGAGGTEVLRVIRENVQSIESLKEDD